MHRYYGTYLVHLVRETLKRAKAGLSVKEIAARINQFQSSREQRNLEVRVRRAIATLEGEEDLTRETAGLEGNLICFKYTLNGNGKRPELPSEA